MPDRPAGESHEAGPTEPPRADPPGGSERAFGGEHALADHLHEWSDDPTALGVAGVAMSERHPVAGLYLAMQAREAAEERGERAGFLTKLAIFSSVARIVYTIVFLIVFIIVLIVIIHAASSQNNSYGPDGFVSLAHHVATRITHTG